MKATATAVPAAAPSTGDSVVLEATGLGRRFGPVTAVESVDLTLRVGARHAVIGPNGAGKTTLLGLLAGTLRLSTGRMWLAGRDVTRYGPARRARAGIHRSFQTPTTFPTLSTVDNLVVAGWRHLAPSQTLRRRAYPALRQRALRQLAALHLSDHASRPSASLSHGQQRLLDIGMALAGHPSVLLLDEPAAGLDSDTDLDTLVTVLLNLPPKVAVVLVEHHMDVVAAIADTVTVLHHGKVLTTTSPDAVASHPEVRRANLDPSTAGG